MKGKKRPVELQQFIDSFYLPKELKRLFIDLEKNSPRDIKAIIFKEKRRRYQKEYLLRNTALAEKRKLAARAWRLAKKELKNV